MPFCSLRYRKRNASRAFGQSGHLRLQPPSPLMSYVPGDKGLADLTQGSCQVLGLATCSVTVSQAEPDGARLKQPMLVIRSLSVICFLVFGLRIGERGIHRLGDLGLHASFAVPVEANELLDADDGAELAHELVIWAE